MNPQDYNPNNSQNNAQNPANQPAQFGDGFMNNGANNQQQFVDVYQSPQVQQNYYQQSQMGNNSQFNQVAQSVPQNQLSPIQSYNQSLNNENPYTVEYLNSIAPKPPVSFWTKGKLMLVAFVVLGGALASFLLLNNSGGSTTNSQAVTKLYYNISQMQTISTNYQKRLRNPDIVALNAGLTSSLASSQTSLYNYMESKKIEILKESKAKKTQLYTSVAEEYEKLDKELDEAFLKTSLDETYARDVGYQLSIIKSLATRLKDRLRTKTADATLDPIIANLEISIKSFSDYKSK